MGDSHNKSQTRMRIILVISTALVALCPATSGLKTSDTNTKAASPYTNCGCQCSNLQFRDKYNKRQGNCESADHTGAKWCYVDPSQSTCQDLSYTSKRFPGTPWSYEACATPACGGYNNGGYNNGGYNNGGLNNGGFNNGGYNNGGSINGGYGSSNCRGTKCGSGSINGGYNNGGSIGGSTSGGYNNGGYGSSNCRGTKCGSGYNSGSFGSGSSGYNNGVGSGSGSYGSGSNTGFLAGILGGRSKTEEDDSVKFGN